jgi:hypothetical protein
VRLIENSRLINVYGVIFIIQSLKHKQEYIFSIFKTKWNLFNYAMLKYIQLEYIFPKHSYDVQVNYILNTSFCDRISYLSLILLGAFTTLCTQY